MNIAKASRVTGAAFAVLTALSACSLLRDLNADQCELDSDCQALGAKFAGRLCVAGVCVQPGGTSGTGGSSGLGGNGSGGVSGGISGGGASGDSGASGSGGCTTNAECLAESGNFMPTACIDGACVPLLSDDCPLVLPQTDDLWMTNLTTGNAIIYGAFAYVPANLLGLGTRNYDLALTEFTRKNNGLPGAGGKSRGLVMVVCRNNFAAQSNLDASMDHLVSDLHVPGIVGALLADDLQHAFEYKGLDNNVFFLSPIESDSTLVALNDNGLMWHMLPGGQSVGQTYAPLLDRTITYLRDVANPPKIGSSETVRVALVTASDVRFLSDIGDTVTQTISFNGLSALDNYTNGNFKPVSITSVYTNPNADLSAQILELQNFNPHIVIAAAADEFLAKIVPALETTTDGGTKTGPFYLLSPYHYNNPQLPTLLNDDPAVRARLAGVNIASAPSLALYNTYKAAFDSTYPDVAGAQSAGYENYYDAAYFLLYATAAAGNVPTLRGDHIAAGMDRLLNGTGYNVGQTDMPNALGALAPSGATITLNGTLGPPTFDDATGARIGPGSVWCVDNSFTSKVDVLRYDSSSMQLTGTFPCITGF